MVLLSCCRAVLILQLSLKNDLEQTTQAAKEHVARSKAKLQAQLAGLPCVEALLVSRLSVCPSFQQSVGRSHSR